VAGEEEAEPDGEVAEVVISNLLMGRLCKPQVTDRSRAEKL